MTVSQLRRIIGGGIVWDNHACMPLERGDHSQMLALERCRQAGLNVVSLNVASGDQTSAEAIGMLATFRRWISQHSDTVFSVATARDAVRAASAGKLGICFDIEGTAVLDGEIDMIQLYYDLGVRWMLTAYNHGNAAGGGCLDFDDAGLTAFGRAVVSEMNRVGMVVCGSHAGYRTARELIDTSSQPIIFSHSNPRSVWDSPRNIPDDLILACARRGGVIGLNGIGPFLGPNDARIETFANHVDHTLALVGEDHVGIALDYCFGEENGLIEFMATYPTLFPPDQGCGDGMKMISPWRLGEIAAALSDRGLRPPTLAKLFGGNHLRIAETVWR
jgi:membrane dipeptidase